MANITVEDANAWADKAKLTLGSLDSDLEASVSTQTLGAISQTYDVSTWSDSTSTPRLVRQAIAMQYMGWYYQRTYSEDDEINSYGLLLMARAKELIDSIVSGAFVLTDSDQTGPESTSQPLFYPTDASSSPYVTPYDLRHDPSLGPAKFSMGKVF